ncbi:hypothetical protein RJ640_023122 [Escallonia rubra]|uniref:Uncharacterized protein n=1 Tax=Escallonia rubra TaxID=112253 RepID=A0AA88RCE5_9ASTE|nr:hypothetical protein RJ640_023122 [Escallonia rubra]
MVKGPKAERSQRDGNQILLCLCSSILYVPYEKKEERLKGKTLPYVYIARSAASLLRASESSRLLENSELGSDCKQLQHFSTVEVESKANAQEEQRSDFQFPFGDWFSHPWSKSRQKHQSPSDRSLESTSREHRNQGLQPSPFLPKITMVGISTSEAGQMSKATLKKTMDDLTKELEKTDQGNVAGSTSHEFAYDDRDPLFVANVGDSYSGMSKAGAARWFLDCLKRQSFYLYDQCSMQGPRIFPVMRGQVFVECYEAE